MRTRVSGLVLDVEEETLRVRTGTGTALVRFMLPEGVSLEGLLGRRIHVEVTHVLRHGRDPIVDATIRDAAGDLVLWGRDGGIAPDRVAHGIALRVAHAADGAPRLAVGSAAGMTIVGAREHAEVLLDEGRFTVLVTRVAHDEASLVFARR